MDTNHRSLSPPSDTTPGPGPDLTSYREIHHTIRAANDQLIAGLDALPPTSPRPATAKALRRWFGGYRQELGGHHTVEDDLFFPALAERVPSYADYAATLDDDHHRTDELVEAVGIELDRLVAGSSWSESRAAAIVAAVDLRDLLARHLDVEDRDILPMFERHFSAEEYDEARQGGVGQRARPPGAASRCRGSWPPPAPRSRPTPSSDAPMALKIVYRLTRRRYARLAAAAFGGRALGSEPAMIRLSLRDLQWRRRRFVIVVLVASLAFGLALVMTGVTNQLSQEGRNTVALFGADQWVVADGVDGPFTSSQLIDAGVGDVVAARRTSSVASPILIGRTTDRRH